MHTNQVTDFDEGFKTYFIENLKSFERAKAAAFCGQLTLTEGTQFFFERSYSSRLAQAIESILPDLAKTGEDIFLVKLKCNKEGLPVVTVVDEDIELLISLPDFPIKDRDFRFYLYRDMGGVFTLRLFSEA